MSLQELSTKADAELLLYAVGGATRALAHDTQRGRVLITIVIRLVSQNLISSNRASLTCSCHSFYQPESICTPALTHLTLYIQEF